MKHLYVDDCINILELVDQYFCGPDDIRPLVTNDPDEALHLVADGAVDMVSCEFDLRPSGGIWFFRSVRDLVPDMPFVFVTSYPPVSRLNEVLRSERNVQVVYKNGSKRDFLPTLRSAFVAAFEQRLKL
jgi:two-component SAPR family response regulator